MYGRGMPSISCDFTSHFGREATLQLFAEEFVCVWIQAPDRRECDPCPAGVDGVMKINILLAGGDPPNHLVSALAHVRD